MTSMDSGAAALINVRSAPSSTSRAARAASGRRDDSEDHPGKLCSENHRFFITDDNFARNQDWEVLFDRLIVLRSEGFPNVGFTIQVDTLCHKIPNFIEKAARAGVRRVFIGLENINPDNLIAAKKRQKRSPNTGEMLQKWRTHGVITCAGYIIGFPGTARIDPAGYRDHQEGTAARYFGSVT